MQCRTSAECITRVFKEYFLALSVVEVADNEFAMSLAEECCQGWEEGGDGGDERLEVVHVE